MMPNAELNKTLLKLSSIAECARGNHTFEFTSLAHLLDADFLTYCYYGLDRNKAVGYPFDIAGHGQVFRIKLN
jgi:hypothetical protein